MCRIDLEEPDEYQGIYREGKYFKLAIRGFDTSDGDTNVVVKGK